MTHLKPLAEAALIGFSLFCAPAPGAQEALPPAARTDVGLVATRWNLRALDAKPLDACEGRRTPHLVLDGRGKLSGSGGCNRLIGGYTLEGAALSFGPVATTMRACLCGGADERRFLAALGRAARWRTEGCELSLSDAQGREILRFVAEDPAPER